VRAHPAKFEGKIAVLIPMRLLHRSTVANFRINAVHIYLGSKSALIEIKRRPAMPDSFV
jgi:hypothetical protein